MSKEEELIYYDEWMRAIDTFELAMGGLVKRLDANEEELIIKVINLCCWFAKGLPYKPELYSEMISKIEEMGKEFKEGEDQCP